MVKATYVDKNGLTRGAWREEEDIKLRDYILRYKAWNWRQLPKLAGLARCGKSCRLRWENYLKPGLKRGNFTNQEKELILRLHQKHGNKWSLIAKSMPGRTDNEIKNYWHTKSKRMKPTQFTENGIKSFGQLQVLDQNKEGSAASAGSDLSPQNREENTNVFDCSSPISPPSILSTLSELDLVPTSYGFSNILMVCSTSFNSTEVYNSPETNDMVVDSSKDEVLPTTWEDFEPPTGVEWTAEDWFDFGMSPLVDNQNPMDSYVESFGSLCNEPPFLDSSNTTFPEETSFGTFENLSFDAFFFQQFYACYR